MLCPNLSFTVENKGSLHIKGSSHFKLNIMNEKSNFLKV